MMRFYFEHKSGVQFRGASSASTKKIYLKFSSENFTAVIYIPTMINLTSYNCRIPLVVGYVFKENSKGILFTSLY